MSVAATVNYHVRSDETQAYHIDVGGVVGQITGPELAATEICVADERGRDVSVDFPTDSVSFKYRPTTVTSFEADRAEWEATYDNELAAFLAEELGARQVIVFDHTVRIDHPDAGRKPARNVHSDYSPDGAKQRLVDLLGADEASNWSQGHYGFVNVWRPIDRPIETAPLGFIRPDTVHADDWITISLIYPDRLGQIMGLAPNEHHEWIYRSRMTRDEVAFFNIYDSEGLRSIGHSAIDLLTPPPSTYPRKSIESRTLLRYA